MDVHIRRHQHTRTQARGATPELRRVADSTSHGLSAGRHSTPTTEGRPSLCGRPKKGEGEGERGSSKNILGLELVARLGL